MSEIILGDRYVIQNEIGAGGMAIVYRAFDKVLNRNVAIKVLRPEFKQDAEFIRRFDIEAKAAAGLNQPNIVAIHDVGIHDGLHYIVMEYIDGITLKEYITKNGRLPWQTALKISSKICTALSNAHEHKVIHRDIKPHNIMIGNDGTVKVMDFGIARATSAATMTIGSKVLGSAHYLSPEQARGGFTDERSDIYSLGVCMYEMITGRVPFDADTTVAVAMQHLQKEPTTPKSFVPDLPDAVEHIILKAMRKEQAQRYSSARLMESDIIRTLADPNVKLTDEDSDSAGFYSTRPITPVQDEHKEMKSFSEKHKEIADEKKNKKAVIGAVVAAAIVIIAVLFMLRGVLFGIGTKTVVPNLKGLTLEQAEKAVAELDSDIVIIVEKEQYSTEDEVDKIIEQEPENGRKLPGSKEIYVIIGIGEEEFEIEDYVGTDAETAKGKAEDMGLVCTIAEEDDEALNEEYSKDCVTRQVPEAGTKVKSGKTITLYKSKGVDEDSQKVVDVMGMTASAAKKKLSENGFTNITIEYKNDNSPEGTVIDQSESAGTRIKKDSKIVLTVSMGKDETVTTEPPKKETGLKFTLPGTPDEMQVKVVRKDNGATVYNMKHKAGDTVSIDVKVTETTTYEIWIDNAYWTEKSVEG